MQGLGLKLERLFRGLYVEVKGKALIRLQCNKKHVGVDLARAKMFEHTNRRWPEGNCDLGLPFWKPLSRPDIERDPMPSPVVDLKL